MAGRFVAGDWGYDRAIANCLPSSLVGFNRGGAVEHQRVLCEVALRRGLVGAARSVLASGFRLRRAMATGSAAKLFLETRPDDDSFRGDELHVPDRNGQR